MSDPDPERAERGAAVDPRGPRARTGRRGWLLGAACAVLALEVVWLALENRRLEARLALAAEGGPSRDAAARPRLAVGHLLGDFGVRRADGEVARVAFDGEHARTLLLVFADGCAACPAVMPVWDELAVALRPRDRAVGLQLDFEPDAAAPPRAFPVGGIADAAELPTAELTTVPVTALVDEAGFVTWVRYGVLDPASTEELRELLAREAP